MKKRIIKIVLEFSALAITLTTLISLVTAWYISQDRVKDMSFDILQIDSMVTLYEANDINFNGVPDKQSLANVDKYYNPEAEAYVAYQQKYHSEDYSFKYVDQRYALSYDSSANLLKTVTLKDVCPSKVYTFKFEVTNYVGLDNTLTFGFDADSDYTPVPNSLKDFDARIGIVDTSNNVTFTSWTNFCQENNGVYTYQDFNLNPLEEDMVIEATTGSLSVGRLDLWLQIRETPKATQTYTNFILPQYRITLSCDMPEQQD